MKCSICVIEVETVEEAVERDWIPSFYDELDNQHEPACSDCVGLFLCCGLDGEWEVKPEYRGKLTFTDEEPVGHWMIGFAISEALVQTH
jgi:hypothetical protein